MWCTWFWAVRSEMNSFVPICLLVIPKAPVRRPPPRGRSTDPACSSRRRRPCRQCRDPGGPGAQRYEHISEFIAKRIAVGSARSSVARAASASSGARRAFSASASAIRHSTPAGMAARAMQSLTALANRSIASSRSPSACAAYRLRTPRRPMVTTRDQPSRETPVAHAVRHRCTRE